MDENVAMRGRSERRWEKFSFFSTIFCMPFETKTIESDVIVVVLLLDKSFFFIKCESENKKQTQKRE
jgi:hypothetical protein